MKWPDVTVSFGSSITPCFAVEINWLAELLYIKGS